LVARRISRRARAAEPSPRPKSRGGRPSSYDPKYASAAAQLCKLGATDADLATAFKVTTPTIWAWRNKYPEFFSALKESKGAFDETVERSLAQKAVGYSYDSEEIKVVDGKIVRVPVRKHVPPDTTACIFWLKNRRPEQWRDVNRFEHTGRDGGPVEVKSVREEFERRVADVAANLAAQENSGRVH
jgi:hypothetical protein